MSNTTIEQHTNLFGMTLSELQSLCSKLEAPRYSARQICDWLYSKRVSSIDEMTNLSLSLRSKLKETASIERIEPVETLTSRDGSKKYLFRTFSGAYIESVYIPAESANSRERATLCVSTQVGCKMNCSFCATGAQGFHGQLSSAEILSQVFNVDESSSLTNIVYMGMGEPLDNYNNLLASLKVMTSDWGLGWSDHRITVSTVGVIPNLERLMADSQCHIAISIHSPYPAERQKLMPAERAYPITDVIKTLRKHDWAGQRRLSFEYTLMRDVNDTKTHAAALARILRELRCRVNLIKFHSSEKAPYKAPNKQAVLDFQSELQRHGILCTIRASRGEDIMAACGLLSGTKANMGDRLSHSTDQGNADKGNHTVKNKQK